MITLRGGRVRKTDGRTAKFSRTWGKRTKCGHARTPCASERERCPKAGSASGEATCTSEQGRRGGKKFDCSDRKVSLPRPAVLEFFILIINGPAFRSALRYVVREGATTRSKYPTSAAAVLASLNCPSQNSDFDAVFVLKIDFLHQEQRTVLEMMNLGGKAFRLPSSTFLAELGKNF